MQVDNHSFVILCVFQAGHAELPGEAGARASREDEGSAGRQPLVLRQICTSLCFFLLFVIHVHVLVLVEVLMRVLK